MLAYFSMANRGCFAVPVDALESIWRGQTHALCIALTITMLLRPRVVVSSTAMADSSTAALFDCTLAEVEAGFTRFTLLVVAFAWSPSSLQLLKAVRGANVESDFGIRVQCLDGDTALEFGTKNSILNGAGGLKIYSGGREVCFRRAGAGLTYTIVSALRSSQVRDVVKAAVEANSSNAIAEIDC